MTRTTIEIVDKVANLHLIQHVSLTHCRFSAGSFHKDFVRTFDASDLFKPDGKTGNAAILSNLYHMYRRQIPAHESHCLYCRPRFYCQPPAPEPCFFALPYPKAVEPLMGAVLVEYDVRQHYLVLADALQAEGIAWGADLAKKALDKRIHPRHLLALIACGLAFHMPQAEQPAPQPLFNHPWGNPNAPGAA